MYAHAGIGSGIGRGFSLVLGFGSGGVAKNGTLLLTGSLIDGLQFPLSIICQPSRNLPL